MKDHDSLARRLTELRSAFDDSFSRPVTAPAPAGELLLGTSAGGERYAVRVADIGGLHRAGVIVSVASPMTELLGIAGLRGTLIAVFDLSACLARPTTRVPNWLLLAANGPVAFAFETFDGQWEVSRAAYASACGGDESLVSRKAIECGTELRFILNVRSLTAAVERRSASLAKES